MNTQPPTNPAPAFKRRQRATVSAAAGPLIERATIVMQQKTYPDWYVIRFDDGAELSAHVSSIRAL